MPLYIQLEVSKKIDSISPTYLWAGTHKVLGGKCKINWDLVCKPKKHEGLDVLNPEKFATTLCLCWLWFEWMDTKEPWIGMGSPCSYEDRDLFAVASLVTIGNGHSTEF